MTTLFAGLREAEVKTRARIRRFIMEIRVLKYEAQISARPEEKYIHLLLSRHINERHSVSHVSARELPSAETSAKCPPL